MATDPLAASIALPAAAREQGDVTTADLELTERARARHPAVRWWWGERVVGGANGAYCYLCDQLVATWQRSWPTPIGAMVTLLLHRDREILAAGPHPGTKTAGTSPAAGASTAGGQE